MSEKKKISNCFLEFLHHGGAGVLAAVVIILIFLLCATWLKSLIFGIVLSFILLPIERFYYNRIFRSESKGWWLRLKEKITRKRLPEDEEFKMLRRNRIFKASLAAITTFFLLLFLVILLSSYLLIPQIKNLKTSIVEWGKTSPTVAKVEQFVSEQEDKDGASSEKTIGILRKNLNVLAGENKNILSLFTTNTDQSVFTIIYKFLKGLGTFLLDIILSIFFGFYFLQKLALFEGKGSLHRHRIGAWFVNLFYNSPWLPDVSFRTRKQAERIITHLGGVLSRWVSGYFVVIVIEFSLYTLLFIAFGVPYPLLAGSVAGLSVLLPFIGPVVSFCLTAALCIAFCEAELVMTLLMVCCIYLMINGLLEQFFLYPVFIGHVSGLTTVETIIVVLIGGLVAGITGMIFSVPAAAIIKYIIPVIYRASVVSETAKQKITKEQDI